MEQAQPQSSPSLTLLTTRSGATWRHLLSEVLSKADGRG